MFRVMISPIFRSTRMCVSSASRLPVSNIVGELYHKL